MSKKEKGLMDMDDGVAIARWGGTVGGTRGLNGNGKKYNKNKLIFLIKKLKIGKSSRFLSSDNTLLFEFMLR